MNLIEFLNETVLWWHWIVFGIALLILDMSMGTFFILGLGIAAIIVGILDIFLDTSFTLELTIWMILSILVIAVWFKWFREEPVTESGQSNYRLDTLGVVMEDIQPHSRGKVTFDTPVLGNTSWHAISKVDIAKGTRVKIVQISGQLIEVAPITQN
ncbi:NfeD family protein [Sulfurovum sp. AR]|uniref:NfeD family protein n=1 Tax=Sulfurovum sp. AR TaxID=1165841 RepID=UPI00351074B7